MKKSKNLILVIAIVLVATIIVALLSVFIVSRLLGEFDLTGKKDNKKSGIADYSEYESENEKPDNVIKHNNTDLSGISDIKLPEDFSFKIAWGYWFGSYYNSETGKMIRDNNEEETEKYTKYVLLSENEMKLIYKYLFVYIDITRYPREFNPNDECSSDISYGVDPHMSLRITVFANGKEHTVEVDDYTCIADRTAPFTKSMDSIVKLLTSTPEWKAFPDLTFGYM